MDTSTIDLQGRYINHQSSKVDTSIFESRHIDLRRSTHRDLDLRKSTHRSSKIEGGNITPTIRRRILSTTALLYTKHFTGRYQKPTSLPISCTLCNQVEDEIHLICLCKRNAHLRIDLFIFVQSLYPPFQFMLPKEKVIYIMQNKDYVVINNFAAFIYRSLLLVN